MPLDFDLTDEQQMLRKMVRNFAEKEIAPIAQELDDKEEFSYPLTKRIFPTSLLSKRLPESMVLKLPPSQLETPLGSPPSIITGMRDRKKHGCPISVQEKLFPLSV
jgi:hypothetical protein